MYVHISIIIIKYRTIIIVDIFYDGVSHSQPVL